MPTRKKNNTDYLFLIPAAVIYLSVIVLPVLYSLTISLFKWNGIGAMEYIGLQNYINLFANDPIFIQAMKNNLIWIVLSLAITMTVSLAFAVVLNKQFVGRTFFRASFIFRRSSRRSRSPLSGAGCITRASALLTSFPAR